MPKRGGTPFRELRTQPDEFYGAIVLSGRYHPGIVTTENNSSINVGSTINRLLAYPYWVSRSMAVDQIAISVDTSQVASNVRVGIYGSGDDGLPANLLVESASFDSSTTGAKTTAITLHLPGPRLYWGAAVTNVSGVQIRSRTGDAAIMLGLTGATSNDPASIGFVGHTFGALPDPFGAFTIITAEQSHGWVMLRVA